MVRIGVDLGGTKIEAAGLAADGREAARLRVATPRDDYAGTIDAIARIVAETAHAAEAAGAPAARGIGIGIPGSLSPVTGLVRNANSTWLNGKPLARDLEAALGRPVRLANDANCFALSEAADGAAAGSASVFGVILGTGVGGGLVVNGVLVAGANAIAGEWGHVPLPGRGPSDGPARPCWCGRADCIETFLSGPAFERDFAEAAGQRLPAAEIAARAAAGDEAAGAALARYSERLSRALAMIVNVLDPAAVVLGGGMSNVAALFTAVPALWGRHIFADAVATRLVPPRHGDASGVRGAARLWPAPG